MQGLLAGSARAKLDDGRGYLLLFEGTTLALVCFCVFVSTHTSYYNRQKPTVSFHHSVWLLFLSYPAACDRMHCVKGRKTPWTGGPVHRRAYIQTHLQSYLHFWAAHRLSWRLNFIIVWLECQWARQSTLRASLLVDTHTSLRILKETSKQWICFCEYDCKHRCCSWCKAHVGVSNCFCDCVDWKLLWNPGTAQTDLNWLEDDKYIARRRNALSAGGTGVDLSHSH